MRLLGVIGVAGLAAACGGGSSNQPGTKASAAGPGCVAVADHVKSLVRKRDEAADRLAAAFRERCERDQWSDEFRTCVMATESLEKPRRCKELLNGLQREALERGIQDAEYGDKDSACHEYVRAVKKLGACPGYTKDIVEQSVQSAQYYVQEYERAETKESRQYALQNCEDMLRGTQYTLSSCSTP